MNLSTVVFLCVVAVLASAAAIAAGGNLGLALPAATIAVGAAALLLVAVLDRTQWPTFGGPPSEPSSTTRVQSAFQAGRAGRVELLALLDALDRESGTAPRPPLTATEVATFQSADPEQFRRYLDARIGDLERRT